MNIFKTLLLCTLLFALPAFAGVAAIRADMAKKFPYSKLISVHKTPYLGLYEVAFDDQVVYTDDKMTYLFSGNIIDMRTMKNLTEAREDQLYAIKFDSLPFELALKEVRGNGKRRLAVFSDPNCRYCKKLERELAGLSDTTVYVFLFPILSGSAEKAQAIWCAPDRRAAWEAHMLHGVEPTAGRDCDTSALTRIASYADTLRINLTPTLIFPDGVIKPGSMTRESIEARLAGKEMAN